MLKYLYEIGLNYEILIQNMKKIIKVLDLCV